MNVPKWLITWIRSTSPKYRMLLCTGKNIDRIADNGDVRHEKACSCAVRTAKFVARKQWIVTGSDDMFIRVYNYNTMDKVKAFEAHTDYIR